MTKLTLSIDQEIVRKAKKYLQTDRESLSGLVERYFSLLIKTNEGRKVNSPIVRSLKGVARDLGSDDKKIITDYLTEKYK